MIKQFDYIITLSFLSYTLTKCYYVSVTESSMFGSRRHEPFLAPSNVGTIKSTSKTCGFSLPVELSTNFPAGRFVMIYY